MKCSKCGTNNPDDFFFCLQCGAQLGPPDPAAMAIGSSPDGPLERTEVAPVSDDWQSPATRVDATARLRVEQGPVDQREFVLDQPAVVIGRRLGNDVVIHDTNVSRQHAQIVRDQSGYVIEDTNSANGTVVNQERIERGYPLQSGDVIRIGDAVFVFELDEAPAIELDRPGAAPRPFNAAVVPSSEAVVIRSSAPPSPAVAPGIADAPHSASSISDEEALGPDSMAVQVQPHATDRAELSDGDAIGPIRHGSGDLGSELRSLAAQVADMSDRVHGLERALDEAGAEAERLRSVARGPDGQPLRDLDAVLADIESDGRRQDLQATVELLDELVAQPRDIELLFKLSQQVDSISEVVRLHRRLAELGPSARSALHGLISS